MPEKNKDFESSLKKLEEIVTELENTFANFSCKTFLGLQAARKSPNYSTQLGNANNLTIRQVTDIYEAYYWREVMLAVTHKVDFL